MKMVLNVSQVSTILQTSGIILFPFIEEDTFMSAPDLSNDVKVELWRSAT